MCGIRKSPYICELLSLLDLSQCLMFKQSNLFLLKLPKGHASQFFPASNKGLVIPVSEIKGPGAKPAPGTWPQSG